MSGSGFQLRDTPLLEWIPRGIDFPHEASSRIQSSFTNGCRIWIKRDDLSPLGFGSKYRRMEGFFSTLKAARKIFLSGSLHGNFLAGFLWNCKMNFSQVGNTLAPTRRTPEIYVLARSHNPQFQNCNSRITISLSDHIQIVSPKNWELIQSDYLGQMGYDPNRDYVVPDYGFSPLGELGYRVLWEEILQATKQMETQKQTNHHISTRAPLRNGNPGLDPGQTRTLVLDIGSGLSFLSAIRYFYPLILQGQRWDLRAVCLGEKKSTWLERIVPLWESLGWDRLDLPPMEWVQERIWDSAISPRFGSINTRLKKFIYGTYQSTLLPLEPIYSGKTLYTLCRNIPQEKCREWIYLHQGGILPWYRLYVSNQNPSEPKS